MKHWDLRPKVEYPTGSGYYEPIPYPPLSTFSFVCPTCDAAVEVWWVPIEDISKPT